jgi:hypothetical protein
MSSTNTTPAPIMAAHTHLYLWLTVRGFIVNVDGERTDTAEHFAEVVREIENVRVYAYRRSEIDRNRPAAGRHAAWFAVMQPSKVTCSDSESVYDYGDNEIARAWEADFLAYVGA